MSQGRQAEKRPPHAKEPPGRGDKGVYNVQGDPFGFRVEEDEKRVVIRYFSLIEDRFNDRNNLLEKLKESLNKTGRDDTSKTVVFIAISR